MIESDRDTTLPGAARVCDYLLGNGHSLAVDRRLADRLGQVVPDIRTVVSLGTSFLRYAVLHLAKAGIRQFLKFGSDIPTVGNVHEIAAAVDPGCRVAYVDTDPIAVAQGQLMLAGNDRAAAVQVRRGDPAVLFDVPEVARLLDLAAPVGLLLVDVLRFLPESWDPPSVITRCANRFAPGSQLAIAHLTGDGRPAQTAALVDVMSDSRDPIRPRTRAEIVGLFTGFEPVGPGVTDVGRWYRERPLTPAEQVAAAQFYVGIGRKPLPRKGQPV